MPRRRCLAAGDLAYHVLNRRVGRLPLFEKPADYAAFEKILGEAQAQTNIRIAAYCLMSITGIFCFGLDMMANSPRSCAGSLSRIRNAGMPIITPPGPARISRPLQIIPGADR